MNQPSKIAIVWARFNPEITEQLLKGAVAALKASGIDDNDMVIVDCPGAVEIPVLMQQALMRSDVAGGIALGCVIQGETKHFDYVAGECSRGLMHVMLTHNKPVSFGVLTTMDEAQAHARAGEGSSNKGHECAEVVLEMINTMKRVSS